MPQEFEHCFAGLVFDAFLSDDGTLLWTVEDGGRIRHRDSSGVWSNQQVPDDVKDVLHRVHFLDDYETGWVVGEDGWILKTVNGGGTWTAMFQKLVLGSTTARENLYDIHFLDENTGWLVGAHGVWYTTTGGNTESAWTEAPFYDSAGQIDLSASPIELYAIDVVTRGTDKLALICGQPGTVWRSRNAQATEFEFVWDYFGWCESYSCLSECEQYACDNAGGHGGPWFEAWDIEISRNSSPLALIVGGVGAQCGTIMASTDDGLTWNKEFHECQVQPIPCSHTATPTLCDAPLYGDDTSTLTDAWRHQSFKTLYGVAIFDGDNSAVAAGYNGQHVYRDPTATNPVVWRDRSKFSNRPIEATTAVVFPLYGAVADTGTRTTGTASLTGSGGYVRRTTTDVDNWSTDLPGEPFRMTDVHFEDALTGWRVGQFYRIAKTEDGGFNWEAQDPQPKLGLDALAAIAFKPGGEYGVTVGAPDNRSSTFTEYQYQPKILMTTDGGATPWAEPASVTLLDMGGADGRLLIDVEWCFDNNFWAVGNGGLIYESNDKGQTWFQRAPPSSLLSSRLANYVFQGVAFTDANNGVFVGNNLVSGRAEAFSYKKTTSGVTWSDIRPTSSSSVLQFTDIKVLGSSAYACAEELSGSTINGAIYKSDYASGTFGSFVKLSSQPSFTDCSIGDDLDRIPILNEIAVNDSNGDLWVGGECGRVWRLTSGSGWTQLQSQTSGHVIGLSLTSNGYLFVGSMRQDVIQHGLSCWVPE